MGMLSAESASEICLLVERDFARARGLLAYLDEIEGGKLAFGLMVSYAKALFPVPMIIYVNLAVNDEDEDRKIALNLCLFSDGKSDDEYERRFDLYEGTVACIEEIKPIEDRVLASMFIINLNEMVDGLLANRSDKWSLLPIDDAAQVILSASTGAEVSEEEEFASAMISASVN